MARYTVVLIASSGVRVPPDRRYQLSEIPVPTGQADVTWFTRYAPEGFESPVPRELWVEVQGAGKPRVRAGDNHHPPIVWAVRTGVHPHLPACHASQRRSKPGYASTPSRTTVGSPPAGSRTLIEAIACNSEGVAAVCCWGTSR
jgi:hypothetical protein